MKKNIVVLVLVILCAAFAVAQDAPKVSVFGGYQYVSLDTKGGDRLNFNGWDADVAFHATKNVAIVGDVSGVYKSESMTDPLLGTVTAKLRLYNYLVGPRVSFGTGKVTPFAEALFGLGHATVGGDVSGVGSASIGSNGFAMALGGGIDINANQHFAVRAVKFDYLMNHVSMDAFGVSGSENLNNYRIATGVVFKF